MDSSQGKDLEVAMLMKNNLNTLLTEVAKICKHSFSTCTHEGFVVMLMLHHI